MALRDSQRNLPALTMTLRYRFIVVRDAQMNIYAVAYLFLMLWS